MFDLPNDEILSLSKEHVFYTWSAQAKVNPKSLFDGLLCAAAIGAIGYVFLNYDYLINRILYVDDLHPLDMLFGTVLVLLVLEATRRLMGLALPLTALAFLAYGLVVARVEPALHLGVVRKFPDERFNHRPGGRPHEMHPLPQRRCVLRNRRRWTDAVRRLRTRR
jgi:hypothetical protein